MGHHRWTEARRALTAIFAGSLGFGLLGGVILSAGPSAGATTRPATSPPGLHAPHSEKPHFGSWPTSGSPSSHHAAAVPTIPVPPGTPSLFVTNNYADSITAYPTSGTGNVSPAAQATSMEGPTRTAFDAAGDLWVANYTADTLVEFTPSQLAAGGSPSPHVTLSSTALDAPTGIAFDGAGDLWVANYRADTLVEFTPSQLAAGGPQVPADTVTDNSTSLDGPAGIAFDGAGNLWVANITNSTLVEFTPSQLAAGGAQAPNRTLATTGKSLTHPIALAFDAAGDLWVANYTTSTVVAFTPSQLTAGGSQPASKTLRTTGTSLDYPAELAFDTSGNLWVTNFAASTVVAFTPSQLTAGGSQAASVTLMTTTTSLVGPTGLAFDASGDLWVANFYSDTVVELASTILGATGPANPGVTLSSVLEGPSGAAFDSTGDLWMANPTNDSVIEYTVAGMASGVLTPKVVLKASTTGFDDASDVAFDATGNLWVTNGDDGTVMEIAKATLSTSGTTVTPKLTLVTNTTDLRTPSALAFDASGDLWVANSYTSSSPTGSVVEFAKTALSAPPAPTAATVTVTSTSLDEPSGLAFGATGNLWVTNNDNNTVVAITKTTLSTGGTVTPKVTLSSDPATSLYGPVGLAFDATGNLWVANTTGTSVVEFTPSELEGNGAPVPASVIRGTRTGLHGPTGIALFTPAASTTAVQVAPTSVTQGTTVTYSATVTGGNGTPTGSVAFSVGGTALCTATLSGGSGSCTATGAPVGADTVTGAYSGDATHKASQGTATLAVTASPVTKATSSHSGYWLGAADGGVFTFGTAAFYGSEGGKLLTTSIVGMAATPSGKGYWEVAADGTVFAFGTAPNYGSMSGKAVNAPIVGMAATPSGKGYWLVASDGGVFTFGTAGFDGSEGGKALNAPIVGMAPTPTGKGYWEVASDGGVFTFGTAGFDGSEGGKALNAPIVGMAATATGKGYWEVATDGGVFTFGTAQFYGSEGGKPLNKPIVGMAATPTGGGYWEVASDGGVFTFGDAPFLGSEGGKPLNAPVVGMAPLL